MPARADLQRYDLASTLLRLRMQGRSLQPRALSLRHPDLWRSIEKLFGSLDQALSFSGIGRRVLSRPRFVRWNRDRIVQRLRQLKAQGKDLSTGAIQKYEPRLGGAIFRHFGLHDDALRAAGVDPNSVRRAQWWTKQMVLNELRRRHREGEDLSSKHLSSRASPLYGAMIRRFGSFAKALRAAGIDPEQVKRPWPVTWPTAKLISGIREFYVRWWKKHARTDPPRPRLSGALPRLANAARARFGSIGAALKAAGIEDPTYRPPRRWTRQQILDLIRKLHRNGTALSYKAIATWDLGLARAAAHRFGSLGDAVNAAGFTYLRHPRSDRRELRHWTEELVLKTLHDLHAKVQDLRYGVIKNNNQPLFWAAKELFGSYENAVRAAGINYWKMSQVQLARQRRRTPR